MSLEPVTPMPSVHVRTATEHDIVFLTDVVIVATSAQNRLPADFDEHAWRARFTASTAAQVAAPGLEHGTTYVIEIQGERAGRLRVVRTPEFVEVAGIQLLPAHQGHGIGTHLIEQLVVEAHHAGLPARATVQHDNPRARALYERLGFVAIGDEGGETLLEAR
ncbi:GNAT family N-acetyltransferase [Nocardioides ungokensis]|uniref:GNAT family N-acetyltransferase n=1 Tax=Nocardioides ungokensis TaxID=1643322 RepID=UPI0015DF6A07|nr:GNAT family N-acetyltransferase [Nocardioides ungokensis]